MKYLNNGKYDTCIIDDLLKEWCNITGRNFETFSHFSTEFLDDVWELTWDMATGKRVKAFLLNSWELRQENGYYRQYQACCLLNTYTTILKRIEIKEKRFNNYGKY